MKFWNTDKGEVRSHFAEMGFAVDPDRFFDVNEGRPLAHELRQARR